MGSLPVQGDNIVFGQQNIQDVDVGSVVLLDLVPPLFFDGLGVDLVFHQRGESLQDLE